MVTNRTIRRDNSFPDSITSINKIISMKKGKIKNKKSLRTLLSIIKRKSLSSPRIPSGICNPLGLLSASFKTRESCALLSQPANTYENFTSKAMAARTFCTVPSFQPRNLPCISVGIDARTRVPSIAPTQS
jgi:hypothetical protein